MLMRRSASQQFLIVAGKFPEIPRHSPLAERVSTRFWENAQENCENRANGLSHMGNRAACVSFTMPLSSSRMSHAYQQIIDRLSRCRHVLVTTHVRPDGDAIGTCAAMVLGMKQKGIAAEVLLLSHLPTKYAFVFQELGITHHDVEQGWPGEARMEDGGSKIAQSAPSRSPF